MNIILSRYMDGTYMNMDQIGMGWGWNSNRDEIAIRMEQKYGWIGNGIAIGMEQENLPLQFNNLKLRGFR